MRPFTLEWWCKQLVETQDCYYTAMFYEHPVREIKELRDYIIYRINLKIDNIYERN
jgi:hypothetical protein